MRQHWLSVVIKSVSLMVVGALAFCFIRALYLEKNRLSAIFNCADIHALREKYRSEIMFEKSIIKNGEHYVAIYLRVNDVYMNLPSGPPIMIFSSSGKKVAACADSGDSPSFYEDWLSCDDLIHCEKVGADE